MWGCPSEHSIHLHSTGVLSDPDTGLVGADNDRYWCDRTALFLVHHNILLHAYVYRSVVMWRIPVVLEMTTCITMRACIVVQLVELVLR